MKRTFLFALMLIGILLLCQNISLARPKIGLVLGGGGARGAAHAGVLKVLEENNIPIDVIAGTSMGSIVGGMYAAGYSPEEIEQLFKDIDWVDMFSDRPSESMLSFRNKRDFQRLASFAFGVKDGKITMARGIVPGQKLTFMLNKLTIHTVNINNFDELQIPFRAVATDLVTGDIFVFDQGSLARAIRASMSVPGAFPPVEVDDTLLIDGFAVMNVPVEIAQEMGADIIIAVNVGTPMVPKNKLGSAGAVVNQMMNILSSQNVEHSLSLLDDNDILIQPDLGYMGPGDFKDTPKASEIGEEAARKIIDQIKKYSVSDQEYQEFLAKQRMSEREENPIVEFVKVKKTEHVNEKLIRGQIKTKEGEPFDVDVLEEDLTRIYAMGDFETVGFDVVEEDGKRGLKIDPLEKSWGPNYLRFGLNLESDSSGDNNYTLLLDYRKTRMNELGAEWKTVASLGQTGGIFTEFYQPLDVQNFFFVAPYLKYERQSKNLYDGDDRIAEYEVDTMGGGIDFGINARSYMEARVGIQATVSDAEAETGATTLQEFDNVKRNAITAKIDYDQLDDHRFPTTGIKAETKLFSVQEDLGSDDDYTKLDFRLIKAQTLRNKHILLVSAQGGLSVGNETPFYDEYTLGGFLALSGLGKDQLRGNNSGVGNLIYYYKLADGKGFASKIYVGGSFEAGNVWAQKEDFGEDLIYGGSVFVGADTLLGPVYLGIGKAEGYDAMGYFFLGKTF